MKPLLPPLTACLLLSGVVYGLAGTGLLLDRPLAVLGTLLIGLGLVRHDRTPDRPAAATVRARRTER